MSLSIREWLREHKIEQDCLKTPNRQIAGVAFRIVQDMAFKSLTPFDVSAIAEVLELPLIAARDRVGYIARLTVAILRAFSQKKPLKRNEGTWLAYQVAYLNSLQRLLDQEAHLQRPWLDRANIPSGQENGDTLTDPTLNAVIKTLRPGKLSDTQAEQALSQGAKSLFVQQMNRLTIAWLVANGTEETEAKLLVRRLMHSLPGDLLAVIAENPLPLAQLQKFVQLGNLAEREEVFEAGEDFEFLSDSDLTDATAGSPAVSSLAIDLKQQFYRASLCQTLSEPLLGEPFALPDLYVSPKGTLLDREAVFADGTSQSLNSHPPDSSEATVDLLAWADEQLDDLKSIALVESGPGQGKSSFCKIWAARIARECYPAWIPIVIRLRDAVLGDTLEQTLDSAFPLGQFTNADGWLSKFYPPCLLLLDGLDELPRSQQTERHFSAFINQVLEFHSQQLRLGRSPRHKILMTSRSDILGNLAWQLPGQFQRIQIQPFEQPEFKQWFQHWAKLQSKSIAHTYFSFLKQGGAFRHATEQRALTQLVREPLLLYLLGVLHRDGLLDASIFHMTRSRIRFEIYDRITCWLLGEPVLGALAYSNAPALVREGLAHASRSPEAVANLLQSLRPSDMAWQMHVAALAILQSGCHQTTDERVQTCLAQGGLAPQSPLKLPTLYFRSLPAVLESDQVKYEFSHPNLGEYLAAEQIATKLRSLTQQVRGSYGEVSFTIADPGDVAQQLYDLLGYGVLSVAMEELIVERLRREQGRNDTAAIFPVLFERLQQFYQAYCQGKWMDAGKAHQARSQLQALGNPLNVLQIDAAVGLNVFLLLCACQQEAELPFWPCGSPDRPADFNPDQLLAFIGRIATLSPIVFWQRARHSLSDLQLVRVRLKHIMLSGANLHRANLSGAELQSANLEAADLGQADLSGADLSGANLSNANLSNANLYGSNLYGANLLGANLALANLANACLEKAQLSSHDGITAQEGGALFSLKQFQAYRQALALQEEAEEVVEEVVKETDSPKILSTPDFLPEETDLDSTAIAPRPNQATADPYAEWGAETVSDEEALRLEDYL